MKNKRAVQDRYLCLKGYFLVLGDLIKQRLHKVVDQDQPRVAIVTRSSRNKYSIDIQSSILNQQADHLDQ